jgi:hypothetical protein
MPVKMDTTLGIVRSLEAEGFVWFLVVEGQGLAVGKSRLFPPFDLSLSLS